MRRLAVIVPYPENDPQSQARTEALQHALRELGWAEDRNMRIDYRWAANEPERTRVLAAELVKLKPEVILANSTLVVAELLRATRTIPIVFVSVADPLGQGFVAKLERPEGNVTGFTNIESSTGGKLLATLKELAPAITRVASIFNPEANPSTEDQAQSVASAAASHALKSIAIRVRTAAEIETSISSFGQEARGGLVVLLDTFVTAHRKLIMSLAARHRLPAIYPVPFFAREGGLIAFGADIVDLYRRAAPYIDRILKGEHPGSLPVQAPVKFELIINLKAATALGLNVPDTLLAQADEVIE
jgi:putative ABC transport system substrate-binding protein